MKKEYVCVEANNKEMVGFVFQYEETTMNRMSSRYWATKRYRHRNDDDIYVASREILKECGISTRQYNLEKIKISVDL